MQFGQEGDYFLFINYLAAILDKKELKKKLVQCHFLRWPTTAMRLFFSREVILFALSLFIVAVRLFFFAVSLFLFVMKLTLLP